MPIILTQNRRNNRRVQLNSRNLLCIQNDFSLEYWATPVPAIKKLPCGFWEEYDVFVDDDVAFESELCYAFELGVVDLAWSVAVNRAEVFDAHAFFLFEFENVWGFIVDVGFFHTFIDVIETVFCWLEWV